jgi:predicted metal-dependent hydrolase
MAAAPHNRSFFIFKFPFIPDQTVRFKLSTLSGHCIMPRMKLHRFDVSGPSGSEFSVLFRPNPRAKRLILRLDPKTGAPVVTAPHIRDLKAAEKFVKAKAGWIEAQLTRQSDATELIPGAVIPIEGIPHQLIRSSDARGQIKRICAPDPALDSPGSDITYADRVQRYLKLTARRTLTERVNIHAGRLRVDPQRITIRDTRSRWGSCSVKGHLSFSWRLILAPPEILDYVAAHEVAHLLEMNHSPRFWSRVEETYGPYSKARSWLKQNGRQLHAVGNSGSSGG